MKKKLKQIRQEMAEAKTAWLDAKKAKKTDAEIKTAQEAYQKLALIVDEAEAGGAKDSDEIEVQAPAAGTPPANGNGEQTVTSEELKSLLSETLAAEIKKALPAEKQPQVTEASIKTIVEECLKNHSKDGGKTVPAADVKTIASEVVKEQLAQIRGDGKHKHAAGEEEHEGRVMIELPFGHSKGNLPVHMKQLCNIMLKKPMNDGISDSQLAKAKSLGDRMIHKYVGMAKRGEKALTSTGAGTGDEWVPTDLSAELQRRFYLSSDLAALMAGREVDMPTQPYEYPLATTRPTFFLETTENTAATESSPGTGKITLDAKRLMGRTDFSYEVDEDAIIPVLPFVQSQLSEAAADAYESALINGDTAGTHQDSDTQAIAKAAERAFNGFRKLALAITALKLDLSTGGINEANLRAMKKALRKYGVRRRDLIWLVGPSGVNDMEGITNVSTIEKYGPRATILTGELAAFLGIPIIVSERVREDLNASGVYDGTTTTKGSVLLVNLSGWIPGRRRDFTVEVDRDIKTQTQFVVASFRRAFTPVETPSASIRWLSVGFNYNS
jgi:hypothetical protein